MPILRTPCAVDHLDACLAALGPGQAATAAAIRAERFPATPNRLCDWCDHRGVCPAWDGDDGETFGAAVETARQLRRRLHQEVRELRELEAGLERLAAEQGLDT